LKIIIVIVLIKGGCWDNNVNVIRGNHRNRV